MEGIGMNEESIILQEKIREEIRPAMQAMSDAMKLSHSADEHDSDIAFASGIMTIIADALVSLDTFLADEDPE
jgi:hypothetical protein